MLTAKEVQSFLAPYLFLQKVKRWAQAMRIGTPSPPPIILNEEFIACCLASVELVYSEVYGLPVDEDLIDELVYLSTLIPSSSVQTSSTAPLPSTIEEELRRGIARGKIRANQREQERLERLHQMKLQAEQSSEEAKDPKSPDAH